MAKSGSVATFSFLVNKSFLESGLVTIPSKVVAVLRDAGIDAALSPVAEVASSVAGSAPSQASFRSGWRAGGRYYQLAIRNGSARDASRTLCLGAKVTVAICKGGDQWSVDIR